MYKKIIAIFAPLAILYPINGCTVDKVTPPAISAPWEKVKQLEAEIAHNWESRRKRI
jgi:hypothetical protein